MLIPYQIVFTFISHYTGYFFIQLVFFLCCAEALNLDVAPFIYFVVVFGSTRVWTKGHDCRQALYHLSHASSPFLLKLFFT
jgi:hypothetical protein